LDIRKWFGSATAGSTEVDRSFNSLLELYAKALTKYFSLDSSSVAELLERARKISLSLGQQLFLNWFEGNGLPTIKSLLEQGLPNNPDLIAQFEYECYILMEEMNSDSTEDLRAAMVNIIVDLPSRIETADTIEITFDYDLFAPVSSSIEYDDSLPIRQVIFFREGFSSINVEYLKSDWQIGGLYNSMQFEEYQIIRSKVQLINAFLHELSVSRRDGEDKRLHVKISHSQGNHDENKMDIYIKVEIGFIEAGPFELTCVYKGLLQAEESLDKDEFVKFAETHTVPFLLPYARECVSSTLAQMQLPVYTLPTIDILNSMITQENAKHEG
jgi:preprotein translocase subunit SecB